MKTAKKRGRPAKKQVSETEENQDVSAMSDTLEVIVTRKCVNPTMVEARLGGEKVIVRVPRRFQAKFVGKRIKVHAEPTDLGDKFIYEYHP
jgi:hypothetical protein